MWGEAMSRTEATAIGVFLVLLVSTHSAAQANSPTLLFTSNKKHVIVPQGTMVMLKTITAKTQGPENMVVVPPDQYLEATVDEKIDGRTSSVGEHVYFTLTYPITVEMDGEILRIPAGASITGHVLVVAKRDGSDESSKLAIVADWVQWGSKFAFLPAVVVSVRQPEPPRIEAQRFR